MSYFCPSFAFHPFLQYLEENHLLYNKDDKTAKIKRFAGASAGAITAALVALGYQSKDIYNFLSDNIEEVFIGWYTIQWTFWNV